MSKVVYVLGAGFSVPNKIPQQNALIKYAFEEDDSFYKEMRKFYEAFYLPTQRITKKSVSKIPLEDTFSLIDISIKSAHKYRGFSVTDFIEIQNNLLGKLANIIGGKDPRSYILKFSDKIINKRISSGIDSDEISIISLNWDELLDRSINMLSRIQRKRFDKKLG